ncbi:MAG TPA: 16S rRNA (cytosine(1402)-N(4))-methyltransferase RsmH [Armatimonadota bacterium]|nr:16S rRNA (cytosine(1402)-N(4))-methyltransferase RsmH [Armatimonadota bacterium]HOS42997.1 16S rRNA (cytosine(1402)-N(4))-methyltransferase RsmH [Armatimonadota bacterium]
MADGEAGYAETLRHEPVMLEEVLAYLDPQPGETMVDCTLGGGGHALAICQRLGPTGRLIGIDQDASALAYARRRLRGYPVTFVHDSFAHLEKIISDLSLRGADGYLFDLGVSSFQLETPERGFSFRTDAPLDLRMDARNPVTAADLVNRMPEQEIMELFQQSGYDRRWARRLARTIVATRQHTPITTTRQFAELVAATIPVSTRSHHPATLAFQALRIAVNDEVTALTGALIAAIHHSNVAARIVTLSYHSLEDGICKRTFRQMSGKRPPPSDPYAPEPPAPPTLVSILTPKPLSPSPEEVRRNPRSRSAKLRAVERL